MDTKGILKDVEKVIQVLRANNIRFFKIRRPREEESVFNFWPDKDSDEVEKGTTEDAIKAFQEFTDIYTDGRFILRGRDKLSNARSDLLVEFVLGMEPENAAVGNLPQGPQRQGLSEEEITEKVNALVAAKLEEMKRAQELEDLKKELKEYKGKDTAHRQAIDSFIGVALPFVQKYGDSFITGIISALNGVKPAPVIGETKQTTQPTEQKEMEATEETAKRLETVISELRQLEPENWLTLLENIVKLAKTNPELYKTAKSFLMK